MRRSLVIASLLLAASLCVSVPAFAQFPCGQPNLIAFAHETLGIGGSATVLTQSKYAPTTGANKGKVALAALVTVLTSSISVLDDGTTPTSTDGAVFLANSAFWLCRNSIGRSIMIRQASADATIQVIYYAVP